MLIQKRMMITLRQAKGKKDRQVMLSEKLLILLRDYFKLYKPKVWLFEGQYKDRYSTRSIQEVIQQAKKKAVAEFTDGKFNGTRKYFYPNGQVWIEQIFKEGNSWTVVASYKKKGKKRDAGTLRNGNGTIIFYNEDGSIREKTTYINGEEKQ